MFSCKHSKVFTILKYVHLLFLKLHQRKFENVYLYLSISLSLSQKIESVHFYSCLLPPGRRKLPIPSEQRFLNVYFSTVERGWREDYGVEKITKIKPTRILVTNFAKFHHPCNLYIFGFCFVLPLFSFKHAEVWRFFNLNNKILTKTYSVLE